jgi:hypothetical protein
MVRDNPVPVALVGTGLVWLMLSSSRSGRADDDEDDDLPESYGESRRRSGSYGESRTRAGSYGESRTRGGSYGESRRGPGLSEDAGQVGRWGESARDTAHEWRQGARTVARSARDRVQQLSASARDRVSETGEQLWRGARDVGDRASYYGRQVRHGFFDTLHEQPLVLGALGLAAGAAIGAALPATEKEDEWLGDSRERLAERAKEAGWEQVERARAAAGAAYGAAREEAERQGLSLEGGKAAAESLVDTMREKAERVAEAATEAAKAAEVERENPGQNGSKNA